MKNTLKRQVEEILREDPESRNSDIYLTIQIWKRFYPQRIRQATNGSLGVYLKDLYDLPREDNVKRIRAKFNADGRYWPTNLEVALGRGIKEDQWRQFIGYPKIEDTQNPTKQESYTQVINEEIKQEKLI